MIVISLKFVIFVRGGHYDYFPQAMDSIVKPLDEI
jgi:hypothetical protein